MVEISTLTVRFRGALKITTDDGVDVTPLGQKERALIALLALAPNQSRSRKWLQKKLWSDRFADQASTSLRSSLYKIRKYHPVWETFLCSNRESIWLKSQVDVTLEGSQDSDILEDLSIADPEFQTWLRDLRFRQDGVLDQGLNSEAKKTHDTTVHLIFCNENTKLNTHFLARVVMDALAQGLKDLGDIKVEIFDLENNAQRPTETPDFSIELSCTLINLEWFVQSRVVEGARANFIASARMQIPMDIAKIVGSPTLASFVNKTIHGIVDRGIHTRFASPFFAIQFASLLLFSGDKDKLSQADQILSKLESNEAQAIVAAWRAYACLTRALEFGENTSDNKGTALEFAQYALANNPSNALVSALSAQVYMKLEGDFDRGNYLAHRALRLNDQNPYAMLSLSQAKVFTGQSHSAHAQALYSRQAAAAYLNSFSWDMQCCLTALSVDQVAEARDHARLAHFKMPNFRPALRYLVALSAISGQTQAAANHAHTLRKIEHGFSIEKMTDNTYPLDTLRFLGMTAELEKALPDVQAQMQRS